MELRLEIKTDECIPPWEVSRSEYSAGTTYETEGTCLFEGKTYEFNLTAYTAARLTESLNVFDTDFHSGVALLTEDFDAMHKDGVPESLFEFYPYATLHLRSDDGDIRETLPIDHEQGCANVQEVENFVCSWWLHVVAPGTLVVDELGISYKAK